MKDTLTNRIGARALISAAMAVAIALPSFGAQSPRKAHGATLTPGTLTINKLAIVPVGASGGSGLSYHVTLEHAGGTSNAMTVLKDKLPDEVGFVGPVSVVALAGAVTPLTAAYANGEVTWSGELSPGARLRLTIPVRVDPCVGADKTITNVARARQTDGSEISDSAIFTVACSPPPDVDVRKDVLRVNDDGDLVNPLGNGLLPGDEVVFRFTAKNNGSETVTVFLHDDMPAGVRSTIGDPAKGRGKIEVAPGLTATLDIPARIIDRCGIGRVITNVAEYVAVPGNALQISAFEPPPSLPRKQTNELTMRMHCDDAGDAPDSTNHFGAAMAAYPALGVQANYPTVFDPATGAEQGPIHRNPHPFHLGERFSIEGDADLLPDQDGVRNIIPLANSPDNDRADDGASINQIAFNDCATTNIPVRVFIGPDAAAFFAAHVGNGMGYLNVWADGNRDGDWADVKPCPGNDGARPAFEHIVIDHPVSLGALGMGLHTLMVPTRLVPWSNELKDRPAWLRFTLSEAPSNKPLTLNGFAYGDGRGFGAPFLTGETEDYLWRAERVADVAIRKRGAMRTDAGAPLSGPGAATDHVVWQIQYANLGNAAATNVVISDDLLDAGNMATFNVTSVPPLTYTLSGNALSFDVGTLAPGAEGVITLELARHIAQRIYTNTVTIAAGNDSDAGNNNAQATVKHAFLQPPVLLNPVDGTTCDGDFTGANELLGLTTEFATVDLYVDGVLTATLQAGGAGYFRHSLSLPDGPHEIYAVARLNGHEARGETRTIIVNSALTWDPISLRFKLDGGGYYRPTDADGRTDESGWEIHLLANRTYTASVRLCCESPTASVTLNVNGALVTLTDPDGDRVYEGVITTPGTGTTVSSTLAVTCGGATSESQSQVLIDPDGVVTDITTGAKLSGASVICLQQNVASLSAGGATYAAWPAANFGQVNPQSTLADGYFAFFTPPGVYRLDVSKPGYQPYRSPDLSVISAPVRHDVALTPLFSTANHTVTIGATGFSPVSITVAINDVVTWLNADTRNHALLGQSAGVNSGVIAPGASFAFKFTKAGTFSVSDTLSERTMVVNVSDSAKPRFAAMLPIITR